MRNFGIAILCCLVVTLGCSVSARQRLRAFFFDVPTAEAGQREGPMHAGPIAVHRPMLAATRTPGFASTHRPYVERQCRACHDPFERMHVREDLAHSCAECHMRYFGDEVGHGPVAAGDCRDCHGLHRSRYVHLLLQPVSDLCVECHDEPEELSEEAHGGEGVELCTRCHDPHFGEGTLLRSGDGS